MLIYKKKNNLFKNNVYFIICILLDIQICATAKGGPPRLTNLAHHKWRHSAKEGETVRLQCPVELSSSPHITWSKDDDTVKTGWERYRTSEQDRVLRIRELGVEDSGIFICKATNGFGSVEFKNLLYVIGNNSGMPPEDFNEDILDQLPWRETRPKFLHPQDMVPLLRGTVGDRVEMVCSVSGKPRPTVQWTKDEHPLNRQDLERLRNQGRRPYSRDAEVDSEMLVVGSVRVGDAGRYSCHAANLIGVANFTYILDVAEPPKSFMEIFPQNASVELGASVSLRCSVRTEDLPIIQWLAPIPSHATARRHHSNQTVVVNNQAYVIVRGMTSHEAGFFSSRLTLDDVTADNAGPYICSMTDETGVSYKTSYLTVLSNSDKRLSLNHFDETSLSSSTGADARLIIGAVAAACLLILVAVVAAAIYCRRASALRNINKPNQTAQQQELNKNLASQQKQLLYPNPNWAAYQQSHSYQPPPSNHSNSPGKTGGYQSSAADAFSDFSSGLVRDVTPLHLKGAAPTSSQRQLLLGAPAGSYVQPPMYNTNDGRLLYFERC